MTASNREMRRMTEFILESLVCFTVLLLVFESMFKNKPHFTLNRWILLIIPIFSIAVPLIEISTSNTAFLYVLQPQEPILTLAAQGDEFVTSITPETTTSSMLSLSTLIYGYTVVSCILLLRLSLHVSVLAIKCQSAKVCVMNNIECKILDTGLSPFTFLHFICVDQQAVDNGSLNTSVVHHEYAHKSQWHSLDILLIEILHAIFWFNPLFFVLRQRIKANHEFLADAYAKRFSPSTRDYADYLISASIKQNASHLINAFNEKSLIKKRLIMLSKKHTGSNKKTPLLIMSVACALLMSNTVLSYDNSREKVPVKSHRTTDSLSYPGTFVADRMTWSSESQELRLSGDNVRIDHGSNNVQIRGTVSYLDKISMVLVDGKPLAKDTPFAINNKRVSVIKLSPESALEKYGKRTRYGVVEIGLN